MNTAIFGPIVELIFASSQLSRISNCDNFANSYFDYDCDKYTSVISSYFSDVGGLAIASCVFVMSKFENLYF